MRPRKAAALARFYEDLAGVGHPVGVPYPDPDTGVWLVRTRSSVRPATAREVERQLDRDRTAGRIITRSSSETTQETTWLDQCA